MRLLCRKSPLDLASSLFDNKTVGLVYQVEILVNDRDVSLIISQHLHEKSLVKPSRPGALYPGNERILSLIISSDVKDMLCCL
jgi:hypothetical protein